ncbi:hypothetical protein K8T06_13855 [bacterium]|nr:hypothetical protein [bacterium]
MTVRDKDECCPRFDPKPWDNKVVTLDNRRFVKDRVRSIFRIPLNFGAVMKRNMEPIDSADAWAEDMIVLSDENSLWGSDVYISVDGDVPGAEMATITGDFLTKVFEGPYRNIRDWIKEMHGYVSKQDKSVEKLLFYYTTCPKCAKKYGKNYVVILAKTGQ